MKFRTKIQPVQALAAQRRMAGFKLIEIVVLAAVAAIGAYILMPRAGSPGRRSKITEAKTQISSFIVALDIFKQDNGYLPAGTTGLRDLIVQPGGTTNWHQYLDSIPSDPWGHPYSYQYSGTNNFPEYKIVSAGSDGKFGTPDDIHN